MPNAVRALLLLACATGVAGCGRKVTVTIPPPEAAVSTGAGAVYGRLIATNATKLRAPQNRLKIGTWHGESPWIQLSELSSEGTTTKKGAVVAQFKFMFHNALPWLERRLRQAKAAQKSSAIAMQRDLQVLLAAEQERELIADRAALDTKKARAVSRTQLAIYKIAHRQARFQAVAIRRRLVAFRRKMAAEAAFHTKRVAKAEGDHKRYETQKALYAVRAPHAGVVRHTYNRRRRRKIKKGDWRPSGAPFLLVARDKQVTLRFFVPEARRSRVKKGDVVEVLGPRGGRSHVARVREVEPFALEVGFLREDSELPNARDKAFAVLADFTASSEGLVAGSEVRVRLRAVKP